MSRVTNFKAGGYLLFAASVIVLLLCFHAFGPDGDAVADDEASVTAQLQRIEDERQIRDLMAQYAQYLDTMDFEAYSQLFAKEGEWSGLLGEFTTIKGPENIRAAMQKAFAARTYDPEHITNLHLVTNIRVAVEGDRATGYSRWTVLSRNESPGPNVRLTGRYDDVFVREDGRWKFQSRVARREIP